MPNAPTEPRAAGAIRALFSRGCPPHGIAGILVRASSKVTNYTDIASVRPSESLFGLIPREKLVLKFTLIRSLPFRADAAGKVYHRGAGSVAHGRRTELVTGSGCSTAVIEEESRKTRKRGCLCHPPLLPLIFPGFLYTQATRARITGSILSLT